MYLGNNEIVKFYLGSQEVTAKYLGDVQVYGGVPVALNGFVGNGSAFVLFDSSFALGEQHYIEFQCIPTANSEVVIGKNDATSTLLQKIWFTSSQLTYQQDNGNQVQFPITVDIQFHKYKFERDGVSVRLFVDDVEHVDSPKTLTASSTMTLDQFYSRRTGSLQYTGKCVYVDMNGDMVTYAPPSTVNNTGSQVGTIQNDDGNRIQEVNFNTGLAGLLEPSLLSANPTTGTIEITADNTTIENQEYQNGVTIEVKADNCTIRNNSFNGATQFYDIIIKEGYVGNVIEYNEMTGTMSSAILANGSLSGLNEVRYNYIHDMPKDCMKASMTNELLGNVNFYGNRCERMGQGDGAHGDGLQISGGSNYEVYDNWITLTTEAIPPTQNSAIFIKADASNIDNANVYANIIGGGAYIFGAQHGDSYNVSNVLFRNNRMGEYIYGYWNVDNPGCIAEANNIIEATGQVISVTYPTAT